MPYRIGLLLPRSTDYPAIAYDIMDGLRIGMEVRGNTDISYSFENIGFGENYSLNYAAAEKLFLNENVNVVIAYCNSQNAEQLYSLAEGIQKPLLFLDAGMQFPDANPSVWCYHISLQGINGCYYNGQNAGHAGRKVLVATSFYDAGYRGPVCNEAGITDAGGTICGNYVSSHRLAEFTIEAYRALLTEQQPQAVTASFSTYLAELFFQGLQSGNASRYEAPVYCTPYMAEEQMLARVDFPGGEFHTVVPWGSDLQNNEQVQFKSAIFNEKNKAANIFHLLGWEASLVAESIQRDRINSLGNFQYASPRGMVRFHPETHYTFAPLYRGNIIAGADGKCRLKILEETAISADDHKHLFAKYSNGGAAGWKNNYFCI